MATISERLAYVLTFDTSSGVKSLEKFGNTADKELGKADQRLDRLGSNMTKFGAGAVAFAGLAGAGLVKMASGAADASANMSALEQVVGDVSAQAIGRWAEDSARSVGLASKEAVAASTQFAGLGKIIGLANEPLADFAQQHVELAADMAAFKNVSPQQAIEDLSSAYAGSTEVMRKYNIFLDERTLKEAYARETGEKVTGTLSTQQKIIAINSELYRQGADMIGQFGRESGELAGQQAILRAELTNLSDNIGAGVLPMLVSMMGVATKVTGALSSLSPEAQAMAGRFAALGVAGIALIGTLSMVAGQVIKMRDRFHDAEGGLNNFGKAAKGVGVAVGVAAVAMAGYAMYSKNVADSTADVNKRFAELARAADGAILDQFNVAVGTAIVLNKDLNDTIATFTREQLGAAERVVATAKAKGEETEYTRLLEAAIVDERKARDNVTKSTEAETAAVEDNTVALDKQENIMSDVEIAAGRVAGQVDELKESFADLKGEISDENAYYDAVDGFDSVRDAALDAYTKAAEGSEGAEDAARNYRRAINDQKLEVIDFVGELGNVPEETTAEILTLLDQGKVDEAEALLAQLARDRRVAILPSTYVPQAPNGSGGVRYGATGGIVTKPTLAVIGEAGPEAVLPLDGAPGASPLPDKLGGGGGLTVNVTTTGLGASSPEIQSAVIQAVKEYERRNGPGWRS